MQADYDWIIIGSGFGGSVSALRLAEKGYRVLVLEKGRRFGRQDFAKNNTELKRWLWAPELGAQRHLPDELLRARHHPARRGRRRRLARVREHAPEAEAGVLRSAASWAQLGDWERELSPHYETALRMLGATHVPWRDARRSGAQADRERARPCGALSPDRRRRVLRQARRGGGRPVLRRRGATIASAAPTAARA